MGGVVAAGSASIATRGARTTITQSTRNAVIEWQGFGIAAGEAVRFRQPDANSVALNRVVGSDPSAIFGNLSANGKVFWSTRTACCSAVAPRSTWAAWSLPRWTSATATSWRAAMPLPAAAAPRWRTTARSTRPAAMSRWSARTCRTGAPSRRAAAASRWRADAR
ncbi:filamentous hemagglutinin N-terminal domain-containing protein [Ramlibacter terrae]|uniref:Filamentous hemagglutinin N-terminal domain-containing protein n=1 Tax=Ramlibacter terrae TaxID=2732511 RepID=A0ABX6P5S2_9BURK|nr:filamentous hemagglutinin N-terminal domain-containing protein [Ramlibacter terrae]